jgi:hypothetical protein
MLKSVEINSLITVKWSTGHDQRSVIVLAMGYLLTHYLPDGMGYMEVSNLPLQQRGRRQMMDHPNYKWTVTVICWTLIGLALLIVPAFK